jgi:hypothetical protein
VYIGIGSDGFDLCKFLFKQGRGRTVQKSSSSRVLQKNVET